jgi:hypothetical protein
MYSRADPAKLLLGLNDRGEPNDLPRNPEGLALAGDPRQDVHVLISQMQVAMIKAHNRLVDRLRADGVPEADLFEDARRSLTWHYQWVVLNDFLPGTVGAERAGRLVEDGPQRFGRRDGTVAIPLASLIHLPEDITGVLDEVDYESLAVRDLQRGVATGLPSGEAIARLVDAQPLDPGEIGLREYGWQGETPLWYYVLREAEAQQDGELLGEVGALIVGEVLTGIVDHDPGSYRAVDPGWQPTLPSHEPARFQLVDLLAPS